MAIVTDNKYYFEIVNEIVISVTNYEPQTTNELEERDASSVQEPYDAVGRNRSMIDQYPRTGGDTGPAVNDRKKWFDKLKIAKLELQTVTDLEIADAIPLAQQNVTNLKAEMDRLGSEENIITDWGDVRLE